jgi:hypothetical protein
MTDTINAMDYRLVDVLNVDQLEVDDLIGIDDEVVRVVFIDSLKDGYILTFEDEFGEKDFIEVSDDEQFDFYILE